MDSIRRDIIIEAKRIEEDCLFSAKGHLVAATIWGRVHYWVGVPAAVLATIAGASALSQFDNHNVVAGVLSLTAAALTAISTFLNPNAKAQAHANAGNRYNAARNQARVFYHLDMRLAGTDDELVKQLKELATRRDDLNQHSPLIPWWAFRIARKGLEQGEARYAVDEADAGQLPPPV